MASDTPDEAQNSGPPRDGLVRAVHPGVELRAAENDNGMPTLVARFIEYDTFTEINSMFEGRFMERIARGALTKTIKENGDQVKVLLEHGNDPTVGNKPLGAISEFRDDGTHAVGIVPLIDTSYVRDLIPALERGLYGSSFRFKVMKEEYNTKPARSAFNPEGIPERTVKELRLYEFGPVVFPAYEGATAGVRSLTDRFRLAELKTHEDRTSLVPVEVAETEPVVEPEDEEASSVTGTDVQTRETETTTGTAPAYVREARALFESGAGIDIEASTTAAAPPHPTDESRRGTQDTDRCANHTLTEQETTMGNSIEEMRARQDEIRGELQQIAAENFGAVLDPPSRARWNTLKDEMNDLESRCREETERQEYLHAIAVGRTGAIEDGTEPPAAPAAGDQQGFGTGTYVTKRDGRTKTPNDTFDLTQYHGRARDQSHLMELYRDGARAALETFDYPHERAETATVNTHIERLINKVDSPNREFSRRVLVCGSPLYRRAFWKTVAQQPLNAEEQRAMAQAQAETRTEAMGLLTGGGIAAVPIQVDPTIIPTSNGWINPIRQIARVFTTTSYVWQGVTSAGAVAQYQAEAASMINNAGTLIAPTIQPERVTSFIPYSWELAQDWGSLEAELAGQIQDAKDTLEATKFALGAGHGSNEPQGILIGAGTAIATSNGTTGTGFALTDVYLVENALPPRFVPNAKWVASVGVYQKIRGFGSSLGPQAWADSLIVGNPPTLLGYPAYKSSTIGTSISAGYVAGAIWGVFGDWSRYAVVDRLGMQMRVIPDLFGGTAGVHFPTGQSGLSAYWRNSAAVLDSNAFRVGTISKGVN